MDLTEPEDSQPPSTADPSESPSSTDQSMPRRPDPLTDPLPPESSPATAEPPPTEGQQSADQTSTAPDAGPAPDSSAEPEPAKPEAPVIVFPGEGDHLSTSIELRGKGAPGDTVTVRDPYRTLGDAVVDADGDWTLSVDLDPGYYAMTAELLDDEGLTLATSGQIRFRAVEPIEHDATPGPAVQAASDEFAELARQFLHDAHYRNDFRLGRFRQALEAHLEQLEAPAE